MTNLTGGGGELLKTDTKGRIRTPAARREILLDEFEGSGLSGMEFAKLVGIKYQTFATWARKRRVRRGQPQPVATQKGGPVRWLGALVGPHQCPSPGGGVLKIHLPGGAWIDLAGSDQLPLVAGRLRGREKPASPC